MQTPLQLDIWLQSYKDFFNAKNNIKQRNWNTIFANISKPLSPTSDSFLLIMSHLLNASFHVFLHMISAQYLQVKTFAKFVVQVKLCNVCRKFNQASQCQLSRAFMKTYQMCVYLYWCKKVFCKHFFFNMFYIIPELYDLRHSSNHQFSDVPMTWALEKEITHWN